MFKIFNDHPDFTRSRNEVEAPVAISTSENVETLPFKMLRQERTVPSADQHDEAEAFLPLVA